MKKKYKVASLFAGIGGICLGFKNAGMDIVWANEFDKAACKTYRKNFGDHYLVEGDINIIEPDIIKGEIDVLTAGFPCQAFSIAGYRKGFDDDRGNLFFRVMHYIKELHPRVVFLENVKNLKSHDQGRTYNRIIGELESEGYYIPEPQILNTLDYGNLPQNRERIYITAFKSERDKSNFRFLEKKDRDKKISDIIDFHEKKDEIYYYNKSKYYDQIKDDVTRQDTIYQWRRIYLRENKNNVCPTLTANMGMGGHNVPLIRDDYDIRKLTPRECLAFQGFPKGFEFAEDISKSACYKQAGNSVSVPVVEGIANCIKEALEKTDLKKGE